MSDMSFELSVGRKRAVVYSSCLVNPRVTCVYDMSMAWVLEFLREVVLLKSWNGPS